MDHLLRGWPGLSGAGEVASTPGSAAGTLLADSDAVLGAGFAMLAAATLPFMTGGPSRSSATMLASFSATAGCCRGASRFRLAGVMTGTAPANCGVASV